MLDLYECWVCEELAE